MAYTREQYANLQKTFAYHCTVLMTSPAPHKGAMGLGGADGNVTMVDFEITPCTWEGGTEPDPETGKHPLNDWDQVIFTHTDGKRQHCGNRCGGYQQYAALMTDLLLASAKAVEAV